MIRFIAFALIAVITPFLSTACSTDETRPESSFGIYLAETGGPITLLKDLIISGEDIESYNAATHELKLNDAGIERWNSYITTTPPALAGSLFSKEFSLRINGEEIFCGTFSSWASSTYPEGVTISESLQRLDAEDNAISIEYSCIDPRNDGRIFSHFTGDPATSSFGIYLIESGELIISDRHIQQYNTSTHEIELNDEGIEQWNSFAAAYGCVNTSGASVWCLEGKHFSVRINEEEIYRGSFLSMASSTIPSGEATVTYYFWPLYDDKYHTIEISYHCFDPRDDPRIIGFFAAEGLLE